MRAARQRACENHIVLFKVVCNSFLAVIMISFIAEIDYLMFALVFGNEYCIGVVKLCVVHYTWGCALRGGVRKVWTGDRRSAQYPGVYFRLF
jgi:hypothetical protein